MSIESNLPDNGGDTTFVTFTDHQGVEQRLTIADAAEELKKLRRDAEKFAGAERKFQEAASLRDELKAERASIDEERETTAAAVAFLKAMDDFTTDRRSFQTIAERIMPDVPTTVYNDLWKIVSGETPIQEPAMGKETQTTDNQNPLDTATLAETRKLLGLIRNANLTPEQFVDYVRTSGVLASRAGREDTRESLAKVLDNSKKIGYYTVNDSEARRKILELGLDYVEGRMQAGTKYSPGLINDAVAYLERISDSFGGLGRTGSRTPTRAEMLIGGIGDGPATSVPNHPTRAERPVFNEADAGKRGAISDFLGKLRRFRESQEAESD